MKITDIKITKVDETNVKAYVSIVLNECFAIHNIRIIDGNKGLFVAMPSVKGENRFHDICHPITQELRKLLSKEIIEKYKGEE